MEFETKCLHSGYSPKNGEPSQVPIVQSITYRFDSSSHVAELFDKPTEFMYSRFANPTCDAVEKKIADLEGGVGAMLCSSGQSATLIAILNLCNSGDSIVASSSIYGGSINLFGFTLKKLGLEVIWVKENATEQELQNAMKPNTKCFYAETIANPALTVLDIQKWASVAHKNNVPLVVDNTFATPYLCRPFEWGADIVIHSTSKYMDGHAVQCGGVVVDSGNFDWEVAYKRTKKFCDMVEPDESYHGLCYAKDFGKAAFITKARTQLMRDFGCYPAAQSAFYLNMGLETLPIRMQRYCSNAQAVAQFLQTSNKIQKVNYPNLEGNEYFDLAKKYLPKGSSGVITIILKGGRQAGIHFMDSLKLFCDEVHVADIRSCVLHPASSTHRQLTDAQLVAAGIDAGLVRVSVGLENVEDIIADLKQALEKI